MKNFDSFDGSVTLDITKWKSSINKHMFITVVSTKFFREIETVSPIIYV